MTWFKVDDTLAFHRKTVQAGNAAMGLWVRAGSLCAQQLSDGYITDELVRTLGTTGQARKLVEVGLWHRVEGGYEFHEWAGGVGNVRQPTRQQVLDNRRKESEKKAKARASKHQEPQDNDDCPRGTERDVPRGQPEGIPGYPVPSRPDPTRPDQTDSPIGESVEGARGAPATAKGGSGKRTRSTKGTRLPEPFEATPDMIAWAREHTPGVGRDEHDKFCDYWRAQPGQKGVKVDWVATWRNWMRRADEGTQRPTQRPKHFPSRPDRDDEIREFLGRTGTDDGPAPALYALPGGDDR